MGHAETLPFISAQEYLNGETESEHRHEYLGGQVYMMAGATDEHDRIKGNIYGALLVGLRGKPCEPFSSDLKLHIRSLEEDYFYYPDVMVASDPADNNRLFRERPTLLVEVQSESTERIDTREKLFAYRAIESLQAYVLVRQDRAEVTLHHRTLDGWKHVRFTDLESLLPLACVGVEIPLREIYARTAVITER
jgi:Uma2 family endonuclease